jgi:hypothetical protein
MEHWQMKSLKSVVAIVMMAAVAMVAVPVQAEDADITAKLQDKVAELSLEQQAALLLLLDQLSSATCPVADAEEAASDDPAEGAMAVVKAFGAAAVEGNIDGMLECIADSFDNAELGDKDGVKAFLSEAADMGYMDDLEVSYEDAEAEVDGEQVIIYPVDIMGAFGSVTYEYVIEKVDGKWMIVDMEGYGL